MLRDQLLTPSPEALAAFLTRHHRAGGLTLLVAALLEVEYQGRAASLAEASDALLLLKRDGSLQLHGPTGIKPINWQPRTDDVTARVLNGACVLTALRRSPEETVTVTFLEVTLAQAIEQQDQAGFLLAGSEADLQAAILRHPELIEPGLRFLERERMTDAGGLDLYARDAQGRHVIIELKRSVGTQAAVHQLDRYVRALRARGVTPVRGILACPGVTKPAAEQLLRLGYEHVMVRALPSAQSQGAQGRLF